MTAQTIAIPILLLTGVLTAHADPVADVKSGTQVLIRKATIGIGGSFTSTNIALRKRPGSLDFEVRAADIGFDVPITIRLRASAEGTRIRYIADQSYSPPLDLGGGHWLASVSGSVDVVALPLAGHDTREGNARLTAVGKNYVAVFGDWGVLQVPITSLEITGGVPQPSLETFADGGKGFVCSDRVPTLHPFVASLSGIAQTNGATVLLKSTRGAELMVPSGIAIPKGRQSVTFATRVAANFVGTVRLTATAGGVARSLEINVHPHGDCTR